MAAFLGIDLGLSGARAAVLDDRGELRGKGRCRSSAGLGPEQDPDEWLRMVAQAVCQAQDAAGHPAIAAIGVGAFGPCAVTLDEAMRPTGPASIFAFDIRHEPWRLRLLETGIDGERLGSDHVWPKMKRLEEVDPDRFRRTAWALDATGFVVAALTGVASMDPVTRLDHVGEALTSDKVPSATAADGIAGGVTLKAAKFFGVASGTPVAVGSYDSYVDFLGAGVTGPGDAGMLLGSTAVIGRVCDRAHESDGLRVTPVIGNGVMVGGWTSTAGSLLSWADRITNDAESVPGSDRRFGGHGLITLPYFAGERAPIWDPAARGALIGLTLASTGADVRRSALEAVALAIFDITRRIEKACGPTTRFRVAGGGAAIPGLVEAIASATGATLDVVTDPGEACAGAMLAARSIGTRIERGIARVVDPEPEHAVYYQDLMEIYSPLYGHLAETMHRLGELSARWRTN